MEAAEETNERSFEELLAELEATIERLESKDLTLDDSIAAYEQAVRLAATCQQILDQAELRITSIEEALLHLPQDESL